MWEFGTLGSDIFRNRLHHENMDKTVLYLYEQHGFVYFTQKIL